MAFARHQFELSQPQEDGTPLLAHLQAYERRTGKVHEMIADGPVLAPSSGQLWADFLELHASRGSTGFGVARITYADIHAWQTVKQTMLSPWEVDCILRADELWLAEFAPKPKDGK